MDQIEILAAFFYLAILTVILIRILMSMDTFQVNIGNRLSIRIEFLKPSKDEKS